LNLLFFIVSASFVVFSDPETSIISGSVYRRQVSGYDKLVARKAEQK
jgi:hypothetical protein